MASLIAFDWNISAGSVLILIAIVGGAAGLYRASPLGADAVETWKNLAEGYKADRDEARDDAAERFAEVETLREEKKDVELRLARCEERPSTEQLANTMNKMQEGFTNHRSDLLHTQNRILAHLETETEAIKSMEQALTLVADRLQADANRRRRIGDGAGD